MHSGSNNGTGGAPLADIANRSVQIRVVSFLNSAVLNTHHDFVPSITIPNFRHRGLATAHFVLSCKVSFLAALGVTLASMLVYLRSDDEQYR